MSHFIYNIEIHLFWHIRLYLDKIKRFSTNPSKGKRDKVKFFVSDMWRPYADMAGIYFKNTVQIVAKYHFVWQCIWALEVVRKREQKRLGESTGSC